MRSHTGFSASHATSMPCCQLPIDSSAHALERAPVRDPAKVLGGLDLVRHIDAAVGAAARDGIREEAVVSCCDCVQLDVPRLDVDARHPRLDAVRAIVENKHGCAHCAASLWSEKNRERPGYCCEAAAAMSHLHFGHHVTKRPRDDTRASRLLRRCIHSCLTAASPPHHPR